MPSNIKCIRKIKVNIQLGQATPVQVAAWRRFWQRIIAAAKSEVQK